MSTFTAGCSTATGTPLQTRISLYTSAGTSPSFVRFRHLYSSANSLYKNGFGVGSLRVPQNPNRKRRQWVVKAAAQEEEVEEDEEEEVSEIEEDSEAEIESELEGGPAPISSKKKAKLLLKTPRKQRLVLKFIWMEKNIGLALDQAIPGHGTIPLTPYYFWPRKDAWEELKAALESKPWISQKRTIILLNQATDIINLWQQSGSNI
uniref:30S ribosomal protein 3, chloroplastic n=1 Tax=Wollemia nobilis TaxID=56998 RepID=A0A0C9RQQ5_9CONI